MSALLQLRKDWCWYTFIINRDEVHPALGTDVKKILDSKTTMQIEGERVVKVRQRAHDLDLRWGSKQSKVYPFISLIINKLFLNY